VPVLAADGIVAAIVRSASIRFFATAAKRAARPALGRAANVSVIAENAIPTRRSQPRGMVTESRGVGDVNGVLEILD
jgi:hypothetical protein